MRFDQHMHSKHSFDCETEPLDNVRRAIELGLDGVTFTEHFDTHESEWPHCRYDDASYTADLDQCRHRYGDRLFVGKGIEVCFQPQNEAMILDHLQRHEFDLVILSVHWTRRGTVHRPRDWDTLSPADGTREYFEAVLEAARWARMLAGRYGRVFDVLGHLDLVRRYTHRFFNYYHPTDSADVVDEILRTCLEAGLIPEVNTSTVRTDSGRAMPDGPIVARYAALGGRAMTLGSDAHQPEHVGAGVDYATDMLRRHGIRGQAVFRGRRMLIEPLD